VPSYLQLQLKVGRLHQACTFIEAHSPLPYPFLADPNSPVRHAKPPPLLQGKKLSDASRDEVKALIPTMLNCYLIQLLETGLLHAVSWADLGAWACGACRGGAGC
jgi:hypothetical protein